MHSVTVQRLQQAAIDARAAGNPRLYLDRLSPLHVIWHQESGHQVGFLMFHWFVVENFRAAGLETPMNVNPYTVADFNAGGQFAETNWNAAMAGVGPSRSLDDLVDYSGTLEGWHNQSHMVIGETFGVDMMNPASNVYLTQFWNFHFFINQRFEAELATYAQGQGNLNTPGDIVQDIGDQHHRYARTI